MPNREQFHTQNVAIAGGSGALSGAQASSDTKGADALYWASIITAVGGATGTYTVEESDDDSTWSTAPATSVKSDAAVNGSGAILIAVGSQYIGYVGNKRYARLVVNEDTSATGTVVAVGGLLEQQPVNNPIA